MKKALLLLGLLFFTACATPDPWAEDISQLRTHVLTTHPLFTDDNLVNQPRSIAAKQAFTAAMDDLENKLSQDVSDVQMITGIRRAIATLGVQSHAIMVQ